jgi:hypothetical protein
MGTPRIEVGDVFVQDALQMPLIDDQYLIQILVPHRSDPPLPELEHLDQGRIVETSMVGGLHHRYTRRAA